MARWATESLSAIKPHLSRSESVGIQLFLFNRTHRLSNSARCSSVAKLSVPFAVAAATRKLTTSSPELHNTSKSHTPRRRHDNLFKKVLTHGLKQSVSHTPRTNIEQKKNTTSNLVELLTKCSNRKAPNSTQMARYNVQRNTNCVDGHRPKRGRNTKPNHNTLQQTVNVRLMTRKKKTRNDHE